MPRTTSHGASIFIILASLLTPAGAARAADCPAAVVEAVARAHPGATIESCAKEREGGVLVLEALVRKADGSRIEMELTPEGALIATEEEIDVAQLPDAVRAAFEKAHPGAQPTGAAREVMADGTAIYEVEFGRFDAAFRADGTPFVEEEDGDEGDEDD